MSLSVSIRHQLGNLSLDADFTSNGRLTAIIGPSGSGKTSIVNIIAGLLKPDHAKVSVSGNVLVDTDHSIAVPVHRRHVGYVFQDARLFPHMTVGQNLSYGQKKAGNLNSAGADRILTMLDLRHLTTRKPGQLSGGEKQRVAIGRALLSSPRLLLMDEPLASLDAARKAEILPHIEQLRDSFQIPIIYVSHAMAEVSRLATDVVVMQAGRMTASGTTQDILQRADLLPSEDRDDAGIVLDLKLVGYDEAFDISRLAADFGEARIPGHLGETGSIIRVVFRARDVMLATERPQNISALNVFKGIIRDIRNTSGPSADVVLDCGGSPIVARVTRQSCAALGLAAGKQAYAIVKAVSAIRQETRLGHNDT